jgi:preprotein translocase subunit SecG
MSSFLHSGITIVHVFAAVILMISVLLQTGKGSGLGAAFGGSSSSVFGARGPAGLIAKVTAAAAVVFMATSFTLAMAARGGSGSSIVPDDPVALPAAAEAPSASGAPAAGEEAGGQGAGTEAAAPAPSTGAPAEDGSARPAEAASAPSGPASSAETPDVPGAPAAPEAPQGPAAPADAPAASASGGASRDGEAPASGN